MLIIDEVLLKQQDEWQPVHPETQELGGYRQPMSAREGGYPTTFSVTPSPRSPICPLQFITVRQFGFSFDTPGD